MPAIMLSIAVILATFMKLYTKEMFIIFKKLLVYENET